MLVGDCTGEKSGLRAALLTKRMGIPQEYGGKVPFVPLNTAFNQEKKIIGQRSENSTLN